MRQSGIPVAAPSPLQFQMTLSVSRRIMIVGVALAVASSTGSAQAVTYIGADNAVTSLAQMVNAQAAAANFLAVAGNLNTVDFDTPIPANLTITGGTTTNVATCGGGVCGFNTTAGGGFFRSVVGGSVTFTFLNPVDAFGFFVNGLQTELVSQQTINYLDGSAVSRTINFPSATNGGGAFVGFIDFGQLISSVTFNAQNDILGFDDLRFGRSANNPTEPPSTTVPEPSTYALMAAGLAAVFAVRRKRSTI